MKVALTGATGLIGRALVSALRDRGDDVTALSRSPSNDLGVTTVVWDPVPTDRSQAAATDPALAQALSGADAIINLHGEPVAQRWTDAAKERMRSSRVVGTDRLVAALLAASPRPGVLVSASAAGYYGDRGAEELPESASPGTDFLATLCVAWEAAAMRAAEAGARVVLVRTGVVLARGGGALKQMLPPFRAGVGGPVAGGRQFVPWVTLDDVVGIYLAALDNAQFSGPVNAAAPNPATNREFSKALGRAVHRPAVVPVPGFVLRAMFGEMASVITSSARLVPARAPELGYGFAHPDIDGALAAVL